MSFVPPYIPTAQSAQMYAQMGQQAAAAPPPRRPVPPPSGDLIDLPSLDISVTPTTNNVASSSNGAAPAPSASSGGGEPLTALQAFLKNMAVNPSPMKRFLSAYPRGCQTDVTELPCTSSTINSINVYTMFNVAATSTNASPRHIVPSTRFIPASRKLASAAAFPISVDVTPLAQPAAGEQPILVTDLSLPSSFVASPPRCRRCGAYVSPASLPLDGGRRVTCALCNAAIDIPGMWQESCRLGTLPAQTAATVEYIIPDPSYGPTMRAVPEGILSRARTETEHLSAAATLGAAPRPGCLPRMPRVHVVVIDASVAGLSSGLFAAGLVAAGRAVSTLPDEARVGLVIAAGNVLEFPLLSKADESGSVPLLLCADLEAPAPPALAALAPPLSTHREKIKAVIRVLVGSVESRLTTLAGVTAVCAGSALAAAVDVVAGVGGRVAQVVAGAPTVGLGACAGTAQATLDAAFAPPTTNASGGTSSVDTAPAPTPEPFWKELAAICAARCVVVDTFALGAAPVGLYSVGYPSTFTNGDIQWLPAFANNGHYASGALDQLAYFITRSLTRAQGTGAILRLRCSECLEVCEYVSSCPNERYDSGQTLGLNGVDEDKALSVVLSYIDKLSSERRAAYVQSALLYTHTDGTRRARVTTLALGVANHLSAVFDNIDSTGLASVCSRKAIVKARSSSVQEARSAVGQQIVDLIIAYRAHVNTTPSKRLIVSRTFDWIPTVLFSLGKTTALSGNRVGTLGPLMRELRAGYPCSDERAPFAHQVLTLPPRRVVRLVYPSIVDLTCMLDPACKLGNPMGEVWPETSKSSLAAMPALPPLCRPNASLFDSSTIVPAENGHGQLGPSEKALAEAVHNHVTFISFGPYCYLWVGDNVAAQAAAAWPGLAVGALRVGGTEQAQRLQRVVETLCWHAMDYPMSQEAWKCPPCIVVNSSSPVSNVLINSFVESTVASHRSLAMFLYNVQTSVMRTLNSM